MTVSETASHLLKITLAAEFTGEIRILSHKENKQNSADRGILEH